MVNIAFTLIGGGRGTGVYNYLLNIISLLCLNESSRIAPILFLGTDVSKDNVIDFERLPGLKIIYTSAFRSDCRTWSTIKAILFGVDPKIRKVFVENKVDVVFESAYFFGWRIKLPVISWLPDFQQRYLKFMFTRVGYWRREIGYILQAYSKRTIMLSSEAARNDCERFYSHTCGRTHAVQFSVPSHNPPSLIRAREIARVYNLPKNFFFLPNQFFKHKNHDLVLDAITLLRERGCKVVVAASGRQDDPRNPGHYASLCSKIDALNLQGEFRILGLIPYEHVVSLMRASIALLNPSLFEGWSTSVEEARSLGTPMILSDLPVHFEQAGGNAIFFKRSSAISLADAMQRTEIVDDFQREKNFRKAQSEINYRCKKFSSNFAELVINCSKSAY
jgi:glycosyltransferase involved in cell wall biosynthesis